MKAVAEHVAATAKNNQLVVVVSAMGEQTDELLGMALKLSANPPKREVDMLLTVGERTSMALLSIALHELKINSISLTGSQSGIITDEIHGNARIKSISGQRIRGGLQTGNVVIVAGFQGVSSTSKEITTLGRGGSDLTAIALAQALNADSCQIYKDVDGVCTADPRLVSSAKKLSQISWQTMNQLTWCGASVLHARGAHLAEKYQIPLEIRSSFHLDRPGTFVKGNQNMEDIRVEALTHREDLSLVRITTAASEKNSGVLAETLKILWNHAEVPLVVSQQRSGDDINMQLVIGRKSVPLLKQKLVGCKIDEKIPGISCITVIGSGFWQSPETVEKITTTLGQSVRVMDVKNNAITVGVDASETAGAIIKLHQVLLN